LKLKVLDYTAPSRQRKRHADALETARDTKNGCPSLCLTRHDLEVEDYG